jgi:hypothetical protein
MLAVAAVALVLAVVVGPAAPVVVRAVVAAGVAVGSAIAAVVAALSRLVPGGVQRAVQPPRLRGRPPPVAPSPGRVHLLGLPAIVWEVLAGVTALALIVLIARFLRPFWPHWSPQSDPVDEERDSVFTWRHLAAQLRAALRALLARLRWPRRRGAGGLPATVPVPVLSGAAGGTIRQSYRRVLVAARRSGAGRSPSETTRELELRLVSSFGFGEATAGPLRELTDLYDHVRYAEVPAGQQSERLAQSHADTVIPMISPALPPGRPEG